jgi:hypothetical protein
MVMLESPCSVQSSPCYAPVAFPFPGNGLGGQCRCLHCTLSATTADQFRITIDVLPDDALLEIFNFYLGEPSERIETESWYTLVHVCRRWRSIVFESPRHLNVQLHYTPNRQVKVMLDTWPTLPIHISADGYKSARWHSENNLIAALEHTNRICQIQLKGFSCSKLENILTAMQKPFPALTSLDIGCPMFFPGAMAVLPQAFLGGSAQHLRSCKFSGVEFPGIWKLLLTANHLVTLHLWDSPHSMHASPEEMVTYLSTMPNLESLPIGFRSPQPLRNWPDQPNQHQPPLTRVILPSLTKFHFLVMGEYIEDFVSRIDAPLLDEVDITFFDQPIFHAPRLHDFLARNEKFKAHRRGAVVFCSSSIELKLGSFSLGILCERSGRQVSSMAQFCSSSLYRSSALKRLDICRVYPLISHRQHEVAETQWLDLLRPFTGLKDLHVGEGLTQHYALALQELAGQRVTEVLPALQNLFIEKLELSRLIQQILGQFVAARQLLGLPVAVHNWDRQS